MDDARNLGGMGAITRAALANAATAGRGGKGSIYVWAAGNGRAEGDRADYDAYASSPYTIAVGAIDHRGDQAYYSESGACLCCVAPSSGAGKGITTADLSGPGQGYDGNSECTSDFGGTSSAAPLVAGVIALMLEERPALTWRDVQGVLAASCKRIDAAGWSKSATPHHHDFGWGLVDAGKAVLTARNWTMWPRQKGFVSGRVTVNKQIPAAGQALCYEHTFPAAASSIHFVEHVLLQVGISIAQRGKLNLFLRSPANETSVFMTPHDADTHANVPNTWTFMSLHHWSETTAAGKWAVCVAGGGRLVDMSLSVYGH